jgi:hypothetical protein
MKQKTIFQKTYPPSWPNTSIIDYYAANIQKQIDEEQSNHSANGVGLCLFTLRVSWKRASAMISNDDVARYFIKTANVMKKKFVSFACGVNNPQVQRKAHFHAIVGVVVPPSSKISYINVNRALTKASKGEVLNVGVKVYNPHQSPFSDLDYIIGKHDCLYFHNPVFTPRTSQ